MYDVIVVGARCAGASLAMLLARRGLRVALLDRARFPSDTISSHFLWQRGAAHLQSWGLLNRLRAVGCRPLPELTFDFGSAVLSGRPPAVEGVDECFCPRRTVLDKLLVDAAVEAGAELVEGTPLHSLRWSEGRVTGLEVSGTHLDARFVVGADGRSSTVAAAVGADAYGWSPPLSFVYYSYWSGLETQAPTYHLRPGQVILRWPTNDGLTCLYVGSPQSRFNQFREDIDSSFMRALEVIPDLREEVAAGHREERFRGAGDLANFYRTSHGPGWALAGDAGHHKDPTTGFGMSDAFASAEMLAAALTARDPDTALAAYQRRRDAATVEGLSLTLTAASLEPLPERLGRYYEAAAEDAGEVTRILGVLGGATPPGEVFTRAHIDAFLGGSVPA
jgi:2-polyprenyl-6-methoxyphenol hydroxylase-like FAD-dependent oxidoreductase